MRPAAPVRVMIVASSPDIVGGQATQAARLVECLGGEPAVEVSFLATNPRLPGVLRRLQSIKYVRTLLTSAVYVVRLLARTPRRDVIHIFSAAHTSFVISATPAILIAAGWRKAAVLHYHSGEADLHLRRWRRTARRTMRLVDAVVVPSQYLVDQFARHGMHARLIPNVMDPDRFQFRERRPLRPVFLCNRQLQPYCNVACVLRAFALVQARVRDARLIIAADGPDRSQLELLALELGLRNAEFTGFVPPGELTGLYSSADLYLNGSDDRDNVPMSILEAFASGLPVCSTDVAGISELVHSGETGMLVPPDDPEQLAASALALLADPERAARLAQRARLECTRYIWPAVREPWLALYRGLAPHRVTP